MKHLVLLLIISCIGMFSLSLKASDYYIDALNGEDSWTGKSPTPLSDARGPWRTMDRLNSANLTPGDCVYLKRNCTWNTTMSISCGGNTANQITFDAYGEGENPVIDGLNTLQYGIISYNSYITLRNITVRNIEGIGVIFTDPNGNRGIIMEGLNVHDIEEGCAIIISLGGDGVSISNCNIGKNGNAGIALMGSAENKLSNVTVENCTVTASEVNGITIHKTMPPELYDAGTNFVIKNNKSFDNGKRGFDITAGKNIIVMGNISSDNITGGFGVGDSVANVILRNNISIDDGDVAYTIANCLNTDLCFNIGLGDTEHQVVFTDDGLGEVTTNNARVYNNTFIAGDGDLLDFTCLFSNVIVENNIFYSPAQRDIIRFLSPLFNPGDPSLKIDYNLYVSATTDQRHFYTAQGELLFTLPYMQNYYKQDIHSILIPSMVFVDTADLNFTPSSSSGVLRLGTFVTGSPVTDFSGNYFYLPNPDAGAIQ